jgi:hypothetical protein
MIWINRRPSRAAPDMILTYINPLAGKAWEEGSSYFDRRYR